MGVILVTAEDSDPYCHHYLTLKETALDIALPCASVILTQGINEWVNGLLKSFNLCHCELRKSNGFCFSKCPDKAFPFSQSEKSNYHLILLNGLLKPCFRISDGNAFDIHYMTLALLWFESVCHEKKEDNVFFFSIFPSLQWKKKWT